MRARENELKKATEKDRRRTQTERATAKAPPPGSVNYVCIIGNYENISARVGGWFLTQKRKNETQNAYCSSLSTLVPQCFALVGLLFDIAVVACFSFCTCLPPLICSLHKKTKPGNLPRRCFVRLMYVTESTSGATPRREVDLLYLTELAMSRDFPKLVLRNFIALCVYLSPRVIVCAGFYAQGRYFFPLFIFVLL